MEKAKGMIRFYEDDFSSREEWLDVLEAIGVPTEERESYYTVLLSIDGYSFDTGTELEKRSK